ncbi:MULTISPECIES: hypothetical protein [Streptomyces]|uniref:hypothetical protein n=1 Tax=Streptomyces TaxID=1883 RepID=UPI001F360D61|nr:MULTISPECIES: hypothetical protein [Streptomyces]MCF2535552.1 hypothetical protein [Streptomyces sp. FB2]
MSEERPLDEGSAPATESPAETAAEEQPPARKRWSRRRVATIAGAVVAVAAIVAGTGYTVVTVRDADRDAGAPTWKFPSAAADRPAKAPKATGLAGMLVPYGTDSWVRGPDMGEFGSDAQLTGTQAEALRKESLRDLPRSQRRELEKRMDRMRPKGVAMRSYFSEFAAGRAGGSVYDIYGVSVMLSRMDNRTAVRDMVRTQNGLLTALDIFRKGPAVKGHKDAKCFLMPKELSEGTDEMSCSGYVGDVLVTLSAQGARPLDAKAVAKLMSTQLDRIAEPGKAV